MQTNVINRLGFLMLFCLQKQGATNSVKAVTLHELQDYCPTRQSYTTLYRTAKKLLQNGCIEVGLKDGKNDTYYLSETGTKLIKECC